MTVDTDVVVIGGGATGCGVARDLAMRGIGVVLVERESLNAGTTGRSHGLLHSGARYADVDPASAAACHAENRTIRRIAGAAVGETGGYFLQLDGDDPDYFDAKRGACAACDIESPEVERDAILAREPAATDAVVRAFEVPDAVVYPSRLVAATAQSACEHGARILTDAPVRGIDLDGRPTVEIGAKGDDPRTLTAEHVVNATGAWAGAVAALADLDVRMAPTRGLMVSMPNPGVTSVLNRCRPPGDGDIVVPADGTVTGGTTSVPVDDPDDPGGDESEVETIRSECVAMLPPLVDESAVRRFWGVRPLFAAGGRTAPRGFQVLDHAERDGVDGMTTVVGGKLTTHRLMAEAVADRVTDRLGVSDSCRTAVEPLPGHDDPDRIDELVAAHGTAAPADEDALGPRDDLQG